MNLIFELSFWQERLKEAQRINLTSHAIGMGFNFSLIDEIHKQIIKDVGLRGKILDFGCGYGRTSYFFDGMDYTGMDFVPEFIEIAKRMYPDRKFMVLDVRKKLPFRKHEFDWGVGISMKEMIRRDAGVEEWNKIEKNLRQVCKKLLILEYGNSREEEIKKYEIITNKGV